MNIYEKVKLQFQNFDLNTTFQSMFATIASVSIDTALSWVYFGLAAFAFYHNVRLSTAKQELERKKVESDIKRLDIENEKLLLENERYKIGNDNLKNNKEVNNDC